MKRLLLIAFTALSIHAIAQTNTFPLDGNVGIGTTNPETPLHLFTNNILETNILTLQNVGAWSNGQIHNIVWKDQANCITGAIGMQYDGNGNVDFKIHSLYNGTYKNSSVTSFTVKGNGNVGIGTDNPQANLHIKSTTNNYAFLRLESLSTGQNASTQYVSGGLWRWELGTGISSGTNFELYDRVNNKACFVVKPDGFIGIGTTNPAYKLDVLGTIRAKEVLVNLDGGADFVFEKGYKLLPIEHVASYVQENKHLPDIPSANEMVKNGVSMGDMQVKLLQKVEELTLYVIELKKEINQLKQGDK